MSNNDRATSLTKPLEERKPASRRRKPDRRIESTPNRLGNALIALIEEKPIDEVTVREVLDRAGVGRSTFYVHYSDKDDLFLSVLEQGWRCGPRRSAGSKRSRIESPWWRSSLRTSPRQRGYIAPWSTLAGSKHSSSLLKATSRGGSSNVSIKESTDLRNPHQHELTACSHAIAGGLLSLLRWWLDRGAKESPRAMDEIFHRMVCRTPIATSKVTRIPPPLALKSE
jgi:AcrR family transcriptional regulator